MALAPAVAVTATLGGALCYAAIFSVVTLVSLYLSSFLPRKLPYALRVILYAFIAAAVYIPINILLYDRLSDGLANVGVLLPMIATGEFVVSVSEMRFFRKKKRSEMVWDIYFHIMGYDTALILLGAIREMSSKGELLSNMIGVVPSLPLLAYPCGGFLLIGLIGALVRYFS
ncbi:MAG: hypothetical protein J6I96_01215 [Oscillospiraceae bacterium]|nr:hypothetical protein [Oscillospiraceae bacterium]